MTSYGVATPIAGVAARLAARRGTLSGKARERLKICDWHVAHGENLSLTSRHFGYSRLVIRRWLMTLRKNGPVGLNDRSHRPKHVRAPTTSADIVDAACAWRRQYPTWSKYKIGTLVRDTGMIVSNSTVGRILKRKGFIDRRISRKRHRAAISPRRRFPKGLKISAPGGLVQIDVKHIMLPGGLRHYQFTAIDVLSKERVLARYSSESSRNAAHFLGVCRKEFSFSFNAVQTDTGAPFQKEFEEACRKLGIEHYYIEPRQPKQNSYVEISHEADEREFYSQGNAYVDPELMERKLKEWQRIWNEVRPHQALGYLTPRAYLARFYTTNGAVTPIVLQT